MIYIVSILFILSLIFNLILVWYLRKNSSVINSELNYAREQLSLSVSNVDEIQKMFEEYADGLSSILSLEEIYEDENIKTAIANTRLVIQGCEMYKQTIFKERQEVETKKE